MIEGGVGVFLQGDIPKNFVGKAAITNICSKTEIKTAIGNDNYEKYGQSRNHEKCCPQNGNEDSNWQRKLQKYYRQKGSLEKYCQQNGNQDGNKPRKFKSFSQ